MALPELFADREVSAHLFDRLRHHLEELGAFSVVEKKASLHLVAGKSAFLGVHPRRDGLRLNIVLTRPLEGSRVAKSEKVSANRYHNEVDVRTQAELDTELRTWLREAYDRVTR